MKVITKYESKFPLQLSDANPGDTVRFEDVFNQHHKENALFLVLKVPGQYIAERKQRDEMGDFKILVANVETGLSSLVMRDRKIRFVPAEVTIRD